MNASFVLKHQGDTGTILATHFSRTLYCKEPSTIVSVVRDPPAFRHHNRTDRATTLRLPPPFSRPTNV
jgi:hypothetical protein